MGIGTFQSWTPARARRPDTDVFVSSTSRTSPLVNAPISPAAAAAHGVGSGAAGRWSAGQNAISYGPKAGLGPGSRGGHAAGTLSAGVFLVQLGALRIA